MGHLWTERIDIAKDHNGADHRLRIIPYDSRETDPADPAVKGPFGAVGLHAAIEHTGGGVDVWLLISQTQYEYFSGEAEQAAGAAADSDTLQTRRNQLLEDLAMKVKLTFRAGQLMPGDEIHVRLGPDVRVPAYGPEWRRALRED